MGSTWGLWAKLGSLSVVETWRASEKMHSSSLRGFGTFDSYEGCRGLYPATSRLQSVPPRFYDIVDGESGRVLASDLTSGTTRARSMIRQSRLAEERAWPQPLYGDMVTHMMMMKRRMMIMMMICMETLMVTHLMMMKRMMKRMAMTMICMETLMTKMMMVATADDDHAYDDNGEEYDEYDDDSKQVIGPTPS